MLHASYLTIQTFGEHPIKDKTILIGIGETISCPKLLPNLLNENFFPNQLIYVYFYLNQDEKVAIKIETMLGIDQFVIMDSVIEKLTKNQQEEVYYIIPKQWGVNSIELIKSHLIKTIRVKYLTLLYRE